jgi:hypothetical protein
MMIWLNRVAFSIPIRRQRRAETVADDGAILIRPQRRIRRAKLKSSSNGQC